MAPTEPVIREASQRNDGDGAYRCERCDRYVEEAEAKLVAVPGMAATAKTIATCPHCGMALKREHSMESRTLLEIAIDSAKFLAHRGTLLGLLATGIACALVSILPLMASPIVGGVAVIYLAQILRQTADGKDVWTPPDFVEVGDIVGPWFRVILVQIIATLPLTIADLAEVDLAIPFGLLWTAYYLPAGLILAAHRVPFRRIVNPWPAIALGLSIGRPYAVMAFASAPVLVLVSLIYVACERIAVLGIAIPFVWTALSSMIVLAVPTAYARFLGSWVREHRYELQP